MAPEPRCSIVIPTHRRPAQLRDCLGAVAELEYPRDRFDVVVVDDGGGGGAAAQAVDRFRDRVEVTLVSQSHAGPAAARNRGAAEARGELLAFTDDDCRPSRRWLRALASRHAAEPERAFGGRTINALADNPYAATSQLIIDVGYDFNNRDPANASFFATNNLAVPAAGFRELGGFDPRFRTSEDRDFCSRWIGHGLRMSYVPEAIVYHANPLDFAGFCGLYFRYGRGAFRYHREEARRNQQRVRIEPSYYVALARYPFRDDRPAGALRLAGLLGAWHLANTAGFAWEACATAIRTRRRR